MKNTLELKHIKGYLDTGLEMQYTGNGRPFKGTKKVEKLTIQNIELMMFSTQRKPILRPLSSLTKEIEVNGEKFVPIDKINEIDGTAMNYSLSFYLDCTFRLPYYIVNQLEQWHFDLHGLIEKGLAIDKNNL